MFSLGLPTSYPINTAAIRSTPFIDASSPAELSFLPVSLKPLVDNLASLAHAHHQHSETQIPIIAIGGCPGVGKTHFTHLLRQELDKRNISLVVIPFDDWENAPNERQNGHFNLQGAHNFLTSLSKINDNSKKDVVNQLTDERSVEELDLNKTDLILFEGLFSLCSLAPINYFQYCHSGIFLEAEEKDISDWKWQREQQKTEPRTSEEFQEHMKAVFDVHHETILPSKDNAHFIVSMDSGHHYSLSMT